MKCNKCKNMIILHAFSSGNCEKCGKEITTPHIPCDKLCKECANKFDRCKQCGNKIK